MIKIQQIGHHNNPKKIKYFKNIRNSDFILAADEKFKGNMIF